MSADYGGTVEQVHRMFADERYWLARLADSGADGATLEAMHVSDDGAISVVTTQFLRRNRLPGIVTQFHRGDLRIVRQEKWGAVNASRAHAQVRGEIPGAPVTLAGDAVLEPGTPGAHLKFRGTVEVRVPLVGRKIENFISAQLVDLLIAEQRFTTAWLAENL